ncbi:hypothetical protein GCM10011588_21760 [Nocardia jinanensis]|uniref:Uncharacterized protein n=3 Tax=Nocardia jinanensis TaxID=382504 RepID=A0A917RHR2_9NOCA|nr:hypothetical protein GCM10011588_21760 [Nocardia jinanensis]
MPRTVRTMIGVSRGPASGDLFEQSPSRLLEQHGALLTRRMYKWSAGFEHELRNYSGVITGIARSQVDNDVTSAVKVYSVPFGADRARRADLDRVPRHPITDLSDLSPLGELVDGAYSRSMDHTALTAAVAGLERRFGPYRLKRVSLGLDTNDFGEEKLYLDAEIVADDGAHAGAVFRSFRRDSRGDLVVCNESMRLKEGYRKQGFARSLSASLEEYYRRCGVARIEVKTEDDGGLVWAKEGYQWNSRRDLLAASLANIRTRLDAVVDSGTISSADKSLLEDYRGRLQVNSETIPTPAELAALTGDARDLGERIMKDSVWHGVRYL